MPSLQTQESATYERRASRELPPEIWDMICGHFIDTSRAEIVQHDRYCQYTLQPNLLGVSKGLKHILDSLWQGNCFVAVVFMSDLEYKPFSAVPVGGVDPIKIARAVTDKSVVACFTFSDDFRSPASSTCILPIKGFCLWLAHVASKQQASSLALKLEYNMLRTSPHKYGSLVFKALSLLPNSLTQLRILEKGKMVETKRLVSPRPPSIVAHRIREAWVNVTSTKLCLPHYHKQGILLDFCQDLAGHRRILLGPRTSRQSSTQNLEHGAEERSLNNLLFQALVTRSNQNSWDGDLESPIWNLMRSISCCLDPGCVCLFLHCNGLEGSPSDVGVLERVSVDLDQWSTICHRKILIHDLFAAWEYHDQLPMRLAKTRKALQALIESLGPSNVSECLYKDHKAVQRAIREGLGTSSDDRFMPSVDGNRRVALFWEGLSLKPGNALRVIEISSQGKAASTGVSTKNEVYRERDFIPKATSYS